MKEKRLDCRGLACPQPVINTKNALEEMEEGILTVIVDNETSKMNVSRFVETQGFAAELEQKEGDFYLRITKGKGSQLSRDTSLPGTCELPQEKGKAVVFIGSEGMGRGDDELGRILMSSFLDTLSQFVPSIEKVILVNSGVKLAVEGSPVLDHLRELEEIGIQILCCGTCLNYFGLKERLEVGEVSNMYDIIEALSRSQKVMMP